MTSIVNHNTGSNFPIPSEAEQWSRFCRTGQSGFSDTHRVNMNGTHHPVMGGTLGVHIDNDNAIPQKAKNNYCIPCLLSFVSTNKTCVDAAHECSSRSRSRV